ncbi:sugar ABC transporter substrate-binding protein [Hespellia stercorisuis]|uniref:Carbohydrate ABC transporter substrate-binding protein, CUT1 family (TC 3.A.1.1.-) n=1 Tax=Hespellia stercorisuis DSM 15480 TaxID=1121950 RepID=A0A1M6K8Y5_9FIRM|nr:sugar ABC transporter substrate-binding protein [Hespellia stercorisuis]SHJ55363.1 carbohydrate ABC transporter substrate-binding protein, CUT1 family (TC 3.A.1.1.-) [Hespellia stercorisuis DSM 15480]
MKKRIISMLLCVVMTATMVAGCGSKKTDSGSSADTATSGEKITFMVPDWGVPTDDQLKEFTDETGIDVEIAEVGWDDIREKLATGASAGKAVADVVEVDWSWVGEFEAADWLEPLEVSDEDKTDIPTIETFTINDKVLAMPYTNDYRLSFYNTKQFEKAGITEEPQTWNDVLEDCRKLKSTGTVEYPFALSLNAEEKTSTCLMWLAYTMNGVVWNDDGTLNKDSAMEALEYMDTLVKEELVAPEDKTSSGMDAYKRICGGTASFLTGPTSFVSRSTNPEECSVIGEITPILVPGKDAKATETMALPEAIGVTKASKNKEAAKKFVEWYTSADMQERLNETNSAIPTRNSVLEKLIQDGKIENAGAMLEEAKLISSPFPNGVPSYYAEMSSAMYNAINKMALGTYTPEQAYEEMASATEKLAKE